MESRTSTTRDDAAQQAAIRRQIAALQAQLKDVPASPATPKRKHEETRRVIAVGTPSPKKRKLDTKPLGERRPRGNAPPLPSKPLAKAAPTKPAAPPTQTPRKPSNLLTGLSSLHTRAKAAPAEPVARSTGFTDTAPTVAPISAQERDDRLALVEKLEPGPRAHKAPLDDPHFERLEPNSGIHLSSRKLPHADLEEHLRGRYYLPPSLLYSVVRPLPSNLGYDVPVPGDWMTIAVIAERGPIKLTSTSSSAHHDDDDDTGKRKANAQEKKAHGGKKYMSLKLVDFGTRAGPGAKAQVRGDALLTLLLFEADSFSHVEDENRPKGSRAEKMKVYKGGSGGAFEACMKLHEGAVIAILNPKILKPYQRNASAPHPTTNVLAITPASAQSIAIIGRARDLGVCAAVRRDGRPCGSWCDTRVADCCEYHVENAVRRNRAGRAEFSIGTSGMTTTSHTRKAAFDPERKWGLLPADGGARRSSAGAGEGGSTYVMPGHVISASGPEYVEEKIGRGREERARRRREEKKADEVLNRLLGRDGGGGDRNAAAGAVRRAREVMRTLKGEEKGEKGLAKEKTKEGRKSAYSAETIQRLGFDPTVKGGGQDGDVEDAAMKRKLDALESLQKNRGEIVLGPRPGKRIRSGVSVPETAASAKSGESDDELDRAHGRLFGAASKATVLPEDSDDDLEIEFPS